MAFTAGIISDTHGLLRPEAERVLSTCDAIIHAGDIGSQDLFRALDSFAPVFGVRGNTDWEPWARELPLNDVVEISGKFFYIIHVLGNIDLDPAAAGIDAVIFGHSHMPEIYTRDNVLYMNPGSIGPRRFTKPVTLGKIIIDEKGLHPEIIYLEPIH